jgi:hypothetical protein
LPVRWFPECRQRLVTSEDICRELLYWPYIFLQRLVRAIFSCSIAYHSCLFCIPSWQYVIFLSTFLCNTSDSFWNKYLKRVPQWVSMMCFGKNTETNPHNRRTLWT